VTKFTKHSLALLSICSLITLWVQPAAAEWTVRAKVDGALLIDPAAEGPELGGGFGATGLVGYSFDAYAVGFITPEIGGGVHVFADDYSRVMPRAVAGVRAGATLAVEPSVSLHIGYGHAAGQDGDALLRRHGLTVDASVAVAWRLRRWVTIGPELAYLTLIAFTDSSTDTMHVVAGGLTTTFWF